MGNTAYSVHVTKTADRDIAATTGYLLGRFEFQAAKDFIDAIECAVKSLEKYPFRNHIPHELQEYPDNSIREMPVFSHRLIYRVVGRDVFVLFVPHGKRSIEDELIKRALRFGPEVAFFPFGFLDFTGNPISRWKTAPTARRCPAAAPYARPRRASDR